jgi:hypothetical protein
MMSGADNRLLWRFDDSPPQDCDGYDGGKATVPGRWQRWPTEYDYDDEYDDDDGGGDRVAVVQSHRRTGGVDEKTRQTDRPLTATGASPRGRRTPPVTIPTSIIIIIIVGGLGVGAAGASGGHGMMMTTTARQHNF